MFGSRKKRERYDRDAKENSQRLAEIGKVIDQKAERTEQAAAKRLSRRPLRVRNTR